MEAAITFRSIQGGTHGTTQAIAQGSREHIISRYFRDPRRKAACGNPADRAAAR